MIAFVKQIIISARCFLVVICHVNSLKCIAMNNQECKVRPQIVNVNSNLWFFLLVSKQEMQWYF